MDLINSHSSADLLFIATVSYTEGKLIKKETDLPPSTSLSVQIAVCLPVFSPISGLLLSLTCYLAKLTPLFPLINMFVCITHL